MNVLKILSIILGTISILLPSNASIIRSVNDRIMVQPSGTATLSRKVATEDSRLKALHANYHQFLLNDDSVERQRRQELALGIWLNFGSGKPVKVDHAEYQELPESIESLTPIRIERLAIKESYRNQSFYEIHHKRFERESNPELYERRYTEYLLDEMLFQSVFTDESLPQDEAVRSFITRYETIYQLPEDAEIINRQALEAYTDQTELNLANFFRISSRLIIEGKRMVIHLQEIEVFADGNFEQLPSLDLEQLRQQFLKQDAFSIKYTLTNEPDHLPTQTVPDHIKLDFEQEWDHPFELSKTLNLDLKGNIQLSTRGTLQSNFYLKWDWGWFQLNDFTARFSVKPTLHSQIQYQKAASWEWKPDAQTLFEPSVQFNFMIGLLPVNIRFINEVELKTEATLELKAATTLNFDLESDAWGFYSLYQNGKPPQWEHQWIKPAKPLQSNLSLSQESEIKTTLSATLPISLQARLYETAGPYISLNPTLSLDASVALSPQTTSLKLVARGDIDGGIRLSGWFQDLLHTQKDITLSRIDLGHFVIKQIP